MRGLSGSVDLQAPAMGRRAFLHEVRGVLLLYDAPHPHVALTGHSSPRVLGLSDYETALGSYVPFDLRTCASTFPMRCKYLREPSHDSRHLLLCGDPGLWHRHVLRLARPPRRTRASLQPDHRVEEQGSRFLAPLR